MNPYQFILLFMLITQISFSQSYSFEEYQERISIDSINTELISIGVYYETNLIREKNELGKLTFSEKLNAIALMHSQQMNTYNFFNHINTKTRTFRSLNDRANYINYNFEEIGENIYYSYINKEKPYTYQELSKLIVETLLKSKEHRENILNSNYEEIGVGVKIAKRKDPNYIYFYLTQDFGKRRVVN